ncbi:MAG: polysaccharide biosynthesis C-terminal domain-containing protein [Oscillospiraceae bacterium]|nr:polysaccharide biosynthesis C-terminal domain-containing protein [Oscillospiraceae bacterium]
MNSKYKFLLSNTGLFFISTFSSKFLVFLLMPIYTSVLSPDQFNTVDLMTQTANLLIPMVSLGIPNSIIRFGLDKNYSKRGVFTVAALTYLVGFMVLLACYPLIVKITFINQYVKFLYLYLLCSCGRTLVQQFVRARMLTRLYAVDGILATVNTLFFVYLYLIKFQMGAMGYILATITADFLSIVFLTVISGSWKYFSPRKANSQLAGEMLSYCLPLIPTSIFWWITNVSDHYLVTGIVGAAAGGIYAISYKIPSIVNLVSTVFTEAWQISAVKEGQADQPEKFFTTVFKAYQGIMFMGGAGLILICRLLVDFMVAEQYYESWRFIPVLIMATIFSSFSGFLASIYMVQKDGKSNLFTMMAGALSNIGMNLLLIPKWGAQGAAIATLISYLLVFVLRAAGTKKFIDINISPRFMAANVVMTGGLSFVMVNEVSHWMIISVILTAVIIGFNFMPLFSFVKSLLKSLLGRKKKA